MKMTNKEAIVEFKQRLPIKDCKEQIPEYYSAMELAISALEENSKLKAEIEQLKAELEQSVKLPCKERFYKELLDYRKAEKILVESDKNRGVWYIYDGKIYKMQGNTVLLLIQKGIHTFYDTYKDAKDYLKGKVEE